MRLYQGREREERETEIFNFLFHIQTRKEFRQDELKCPQYFGLGLLGGGGDDLLFHCIYVLLLVFENDERWMDDTEDGVMTKDDWLFVFAVYLLVSYMCAKIRVWSCLVTDNFGLFTEIAVCKFLHG